MNPTSLASHAMSRRTFFAGSSIFGIAAVTGWPTSGAAQTDPGAAFLDLSKTLTGKSRLNDDVAKAMLEAFQATGKVDAIAALLDGQSDTALENEILAAWYSGVSPDPAAADVLTYTDALMWDAMTYTKPMGYCGGGMGYWAEPPAA